MKVRVFHYHLLIYGSFLITEIRVLFLFLKPKLKPLKSTKQHQVNKLKQVLVLDISNGERPRPRMFSLSTVHLSTIYQTTGSINKMQFLIFHRIYDLQ